MLLLPVLMWVIRFCIRWLDVIWRSVAFYCLGEPGVHQLFFYTGEQVTQENYQHMHVYDYNIRLGDEINIICLTIVLETLQQKIVIHYCSFADKFDYKELEEANYIFAPIIFVSFTFIVTFGLINFMVTIILEGFAEVTVSLLITFPFIKCPCYDISTILVG